MRNISKLYVNRYRSDSRLAIHDTFDIVIGCSVPGNAGLICRPGITVLIDILRMMIVVFQRVICDTVPKTADIHILRKIFVIYPSVCGESIAILRRGTVYMTYIAQLNGNPFFLYIRIALDDFKLVILIDPDCRHTYAPHRPDSQ